MIVKLAEPRCCRIGWSVYHRPRQATHPILAGSKTTHRSLTINGARTIVVELSARLMVALEQLPQSQDKMVVEQGKFGEVAPLNSRSRIGMYNLGETLSEAHRRDF